MDGRGGSDQRAGERGARAALAGSGERGFSLVEAIAATVITTIAVLGLAHTFGIGRSLIDRFAASRDAGAAVQRRMEILAMTNPLSAELSPGVHPAAPTPIVLNGNVPATEHWTVAWVDDVADNGGGDPDPNDYKRVTVCIGWTQAGVSDTVRLSRFFLPR